MSADTLAMRIRASWGGTRLGDACGLDTVTSVEHEPHSHWVTIQLRRPDSTVYCVDRLKTERRDTSANEDASLSTLNRGARTDGTCT